jgi:hypothetical protein
MRSCQAVAGVARLSCMELLLLVAAPFAVLGLVLLLVNPEQG